MSSIGTLLLKIPFVLLCGVLSTLKPTTSLGLICAMAVLMDCYTAWRLSVRVKKAHPGSNDGKFKSHYGKSLFSTLLKIYALIVLSYLIDLLIFPMYELHLANFIAGIFCGFQIWSMLENESSCNGERWAKVLQKIMVDKAQRHFDIDLGELKKNADNGNSN